MTLFNLTTLRRALAAFFVHRITSHHALIGKVLNKGHYRSSVETPQLHNFFLFLPKILKILRQGLLP